MTTILAMYATALVYLRLSWSVLPVPHKKQPISQNWQTTLVTANDRTDAVPNRSRTITTLIGSPHRHRGLDPALVRPLGDTGIRDTASGTGEAS